MNILRLMGYTLTLSVPASNEHIRGAQSGKPSGNDNDTFHSKIATCQHEDFTKFGSHCELILIQSSNLVYFNQALVGFNSNCNFFFKSRRQVSLVDWLCGQTVQINIRGIYVQLNRNRIDILKCKDNHLLFQPC